MEQADIDSSWLGPDEENYTITEQEFRVIILFFIFDIFLYLTSILRYTTIINYNIYTYLCLYLFYIYI